MIDNFAEMVAEREVCRLVRSAEEVVLSAERVKLAYFGIGEEYETLLEAFDKFNRDFKQHVDVDRALSTYRKYNNVRKRLAEFLDEKLYREDIPLKELTESFITDYDLYLRGEKGSDIFVHLYLH